MRHRAIETIALVPKILVLAAKKAQAQPFFGELNSLEMNPTLKIFLEMIQGGGQIDMSPFDLWAKGNLSQGTYNV